MAFFHVDAAFRGGGIFFTHVLSGAYESLTISLTEHAIL